jgi:hypothetical protein
MQAGMVLANPVAGLIPHMLAKRGFPNLEDLCFSDFDGFPVP